MNLKFVVIPLGICFFCSALSSSLSRNYKKAQNVKYNELQKAAITNFVNEVGRAWTEINPEPEGCMA
ncbi:MAG: hypothetical protein LBJ71_01850, partial [Holosporaceae bacterium]|nr:hypothetical protein [Holosporaceae bacterium]